MDNDHCLACSERFQIGASMPGRQSFHAHEPAHHVRAALQAQFKKIRNAPRIGDRLGDPLKTALLDLHGHLWVGDDIAEPVCLYAPGGAYVIDPVQLFELERREPRLPAFAACGRQHQHNVAGAKAVPVFAGEALVEGLHPAPDEIGNASSGFGAHDGGSLSVLRK